jgi:hypothetical protein
MSWRRNPSYVKVKAFPPLNFFFALISSLHCKNWMLSFKTSSPPLFRESERYGEMGYVAAGECSYTTCVLLW